MRIVKYFSFFNNIINHSSVVFINSSLQFISYIEFENFNQKNKIRYSQLPVFITNANSHEVRKINFLNKKYSNHEIININLKIYKLFFYLILLFKKVFINDFKHIIIGDINNKYLIKVCNFFNKVIILDDGTSILNKKKFGFIFKSYSFFSFFSPKELKIKSKYFLQNNFTFFKKDIKKKKISNKIIILGTAFVFKKVLSQKNYIAILKEVKKNYKKKNIYYFPHPKEDIQYLKKFKIFKIISTETNIESYLFETNKIPYKIVGFNTTAFITIKKIYENKIKLENYFFDKKSQKILFKGNFAMLQKKIISYFKKHLKIETKFIIIK